MADKTYTVHFELKELPAAHYWQSATVTASNPGLAANRAWALVKQKPGVKGRKITYGKISFQVQGETSDE